MRFLPGVILATALVVFRGGVVSLLPTGLRADDPIGAPQVPSLADSAFPQAIELPSLYEIEQILKGAMLLQLLMADLVGQRRCDVIGHIQTPLQLHFLK